MNKLYSIRYCHKRYVIQVRNFWRREEFMATILADRRNGWTTDVVEDNEVHTIVNAR